MFARLGKSLMRLSNWTSQHSRPWQIAAAVTFGVCCGLVPLSSALAWAMLLVLCLLPIHLPLALMTALLVGWLSPSLAPWLGALGGWSLGHEQVLKRVTELNRLPFAPWLRIHNTVVHGALMVGTLQSLPTFLIVWRLARFCRESKFAFQVKHRLDLAQAHEETGEVWYPRSDLEFSTSVQTQPKVEFSSERRLQSNTDRSSPEEKLESFLDSCYHQQHESPGAPDVAARASELATLVDDLLEFSNSDQDELHMSVADRALLDQAAVTHNDAVHSDAEYVSAEKVAHVSDVTSASDCEVPTRLKEGPESFTPSSDDWDNMVATELTTPHNSLESIDRHNANGGELAPMMKTHDSHASSSQTASSTSASDLARPWPLISPHDEELRYLLQHLKAIQEKA